jgi:hypothetical protein
MKLSILTILIAASVYSNAQTITFKDSAKLTFSGVVEPYFTYDKDSSHVLQKQDFVVSYKNNRAFSVNIALVKANFEYKAMRANLAIQMGSYVDANLATESNGMKYINEANIGFKLSKTKNIWLDAGIIPSHIGSETVWTKDNMTLTRSIVADNTPFYQAGACLNYTSKNEKLYLSALFINGWQRVSRLGAFGYGTQLKYKFSNKISLNYSTYFGFMSSTEFRNYHNGFLNISPTKNWKIQAGLDLGFQKLNRVNGIGSTRMIWAPLLIVQYKHDNHWAFTLRNEYYGDMKNMIIDLPSQYGTRTYALSLNADYKINKYLIFRNEVKYMECDKAIFLHKGSMDKTNVSATTSLNFFF